ncbi:MAG TPA: Ldh family oxidoreductase [Dehalococcoidia bacterium]|nr:Ldh family oxidoreductase [Dehalococcoidia bacterium]
MPTLTSEQFQELSIRMFKAAGATDSEAELITDTLLWASLHGHDSHGIGHLAIYARNYSAPPAEGGRLRLCGPFQEYRIVKETPATIAIDGNWCMGQKVALDATLKTIEKAKQTGIAAATITNSLHNGANGYYVSKIVEQDMIGIVCTLAGAASPPWGGIERMLGTNPIAFGFPAKDEPPIIIDTTTSATSWAGLRPYLAAGKIPPGLVLNSEGEPTTNPKDFNFGSSAAGGLMNNMAGNHKGYALQLAVEMLGGILPGLLTGNEVSREGKLNNPALIIAINVSFFQDLDAYKAKMDERIREIRGSKRKKDVERIWLPGERGHETAQKRLREGIPMHDSYWKEIVETAEALNVDIGDLVSEPQRL